MNKIILITGASKGIGRALAEHFLLQNYVVIGTSRSGELDDLEHDNLFALKLDLSDQLSIEHAHKIILKEFDHIDILVNNAGIGPDLDTFSPEKDSFHQTFQVNVEGTVFFTEPLIKLIPKNGVILNISSKMGSIDYCQGTDSVAYRMSKSALNMYSKILTNRLEGKIKVANIHPGWVKTTIAKDNIINGRLTPKESAISIIKFMSTNFSTGVFWDAESNCELSW